MSWTPDEGSLELALELANLAGSYLELAFYAVHGVLFYICARTLLSTKRQTSRTSYAMCGLITTIFILGTAGAVARGRKTQEALIENRDHPGGPAAYLLAPPASAAPLNALDTATFAVNAWLANGFLLCRFRVVWNERRWLCILPFLGLLLSIVSSCLYINEVARNIVLWRSVFASVDFALLVWASTAATAIYLTLGVLTKILLLRRRLSSATTWDRFAPYISASALVVDSGSWSMIFLICMLAAYASDSAADLVFLGITTHEPNDVHLHASHRPAGGPWGHLDSFKGEGDDARDGVTDGAPMDLRRSSGRSYVHEESDVADAKHRSLEYGI